MFRRAFTGPALAALAAVSLAACSTTDTLSIADNSRPTPPLPAAKTKTDHAVDDFTRNMLLAAGLDPTDPARPKEIRQRVAGVVQIRVHGQIYGTANARPAPGRITFVDPVAVAELLAPGSGKGELARALRGPIVDVDSRDCEFDQRADRKTRKAFKLQKVCPAPSGALWGDLNRREMVLDLKLAPQLAALVRATPAPTAVAEAAEPATAPESDGAPISMASINLFAPNLLSGPSASVDDSQPAAAPISLAAPVVLPMPKRKGFEDPMTTLAAPGSFQNATFQSPPAQSAPVQANTRPAPTAAANSFPTPDLTATPSSAPIQPLPTVMLPPPAAASQVATSAIVGSAGALRPSMVDGYRTIRESESSYNATTDTSRGGSVTVMSGTYDFGPSTSSFSKR